MSVGFPVLSLPPASPGACEPGPPRPRGRIWLLGAPANVQGVAPASAASGRVGAEHQPRPAR